MASNFRAAMRRQAHYIAVPVPTLENPQNAPSQYDRSGLWHNGLMGLFLVAIGTASFLPLVTGSGKCCGWQDTSLLLLTLVATVAALARQLPGINVVLAGVTAGLAGGLAHTAISLAGFSCVRFDFLAPFGPRLFGVLPLASVGLWGVVMLNSRGVARLLLHRSLQHPMHGYRVIGLATVLGMLFIAGLEPVAVHVKGWWSSARQPAACLVCMGGAMLLLQIGITALLIDKFPLVRPPNFGPLIIWLPLHVWMALELIRADQLQAAILPVATALMLGMLMIQARRRRPQVTGVQ
jgi:hypothetical protein